MKSLRLKRKFKKIKKKGLWRRLKPSTKGKVRPVNKGGFPGWEVQWEAFGGYLECSLTVTQSFAP